jgi:hypothetical protein
MAVGSQSSTGKARERAWEMGSVGWSAQAQLPKYHKHPWKYPPASKHVKNWCRRKSPLSNKDFFLYI